MDRFDRSGLGDYRTMRIAAQITLFGVASAGHLGNQITAHIGGSVRFV